MKTFKQYIVENLEGDNSEEDIINYPGGVYIAVSPTEETKIAITEYMEKYLQRAKTLDIDDLHCTLIYSQQEQKEEIKADDYLAPATFKGFNLFGEKEDTLVIELNSKLLIDRNETLVKEYGFISDFDEYKAHMTLAFEASDIDLNSLPDIDFALAFENEYIEQLNTDWANDSEDELESDTLTGKALKQMKAEEDKNNKDSEDSEDKDKK